ncbi:hypothetical protein AALP_AA4G150800 [Arabis alpina]|uniref:Membrane-associated kinase regulator 4 n=1 Tax=Arabis alpina TaxID=50452 RepID=A0A087H3D6_ARAAL|nr:hypothetical protein AALP_AA4G150800 [Arabis alpina]
MSMSKDDDYIDMELNLSSSSNFISFAVTSSPPHNREFEFQMCSSAVASSESPADELFYKGQLLPLHLPPRLKMVQKLLLASSSTVSATATNTPVSVSVSPRAAVSSPRRFSSSEIEVSGQDEQCYFEISTELKRYIENNNIGNSWSCSDSSEIHNIKASKSSKLKNPFTKTESTNPQLLIHRRSFSGVIQRQQQQQHSQAKCSSSSSSSSSSASSLSSSFSFGSNGSLDLQTLMRSSNASSEIDNSIEGAIEHCKQSFTTRFKSNVSESEQSSSRTSVSTCGDLEKE